jgi:hypothetical protein
MLVAELGIEILANFVHPLNELSGTVGIVALIVALVNPMQFRSAEVPILVTELGILMLVKPEQPLNAELPMLVIEVVIVMLVRVVLFRNALSAMVVTE